MAFSWSIRLWVVFFLEFRAPPGFVPAGDLAAIVPRAAVGGRLPALEHAVVADDARHPQPVVGEDAAPPLRLRDAMPFQLPPALHRVLVAPDRERQHLAFLGEAFEPLDGN